MDIGIASIVSTDIQAAAPADLSAVFHQRQQGLVVVVGGVDLSVVDTFDGLEKPEVATPGRRPSSCPATSRPYPEWPPPGRSHRSK